MADTNSLGYHVDLVMCIDKTGSMGGLISQVKNTALTFYEKFRDAMTAGQKNVSQLRVKIIAFGDYKSDSEPMVESQFYLLDDQKGEYSNFVNGIVADGGGDIPENAYEAITLAFKSDWARTGAVRRHVTMVFTDAPALPFSARKGETNYPADMPEDLSELQEIWEGQEMDEKAKRLILFTPDDASWQDVREWDSTFHYPSAAGKDTIDRNMDEILRLLVKSI